MRALAFSLAAALAIAAAPARAGPKISLNGVGIDGVTNQRFENCTVTIDAEGNVHIEARGYAVQGSGVPVAAAPVLPAAPLEARPLPAPGAAPPAPPAAAEPERLTRRYFLATEQTQLNGTQFDIEVFVNAKWIRQLKSAEGPVVFEVTKHLRPGANRVVLVARKNASNGRRSTSKDVVYKVTIGEGNVGGAHVMIDNPLVVMTRNAAETEDVTEEFSFSAR